MATNSMVSRLTATATGDRPAHHPLAAERSLSSISHAWSIVWYALWRMRNGRFHYFFVCPRRVVGRMAATNFFR